MDFLSFLEDLIHMVYSFESLFNTNFSKNSLFVHYSQILVNHLVVKTDIACSNDYDWISTHTYLPEKLIS